MWPIGLATGARLDGRFLGTTCRADNEARRLFLTHSRPRGNGDCALERSFSWCEVRGERLQRSCQGGAAPLGVGGARKEDESRRHERFVVPRFICRVLSRFEPFNRKRLCLNAATEPILRRSCGERRPPYSHEIEFSLLKSNLMVQPGHSFIFKSSR